MSTFAKIDRFNMNPYVSNMMRETVKNLTVVAILNIIIISQTQQTLTKVTKLVLLLWKVGGKWKQTNVIQEVLFWYQLLPKM